VSDPFRPTEIADEVAPGRGFVESTSTPDWIILSASSPAVKLYLVLRMRLNRKRRDRKVWPGRPVLAVMLEVKKTDTVTVYLKELEQLGAIDIERTKTVPSHNIYRINHAPPDAYTGPMVMEDWDRDPANRARANEISAYEKAKRDRSRAKAKTGAGTPGGAKATPPATKPQVKAETPSKGSPSRAAEMEPPETRSNGSLATRLNGDQDTRSNGLEPLGVDLGTKGTLSASSSETSEEKNPVSPLIENQEWTMPRDFWPTLTDAEEALYAECLAVRPDWSGRSLRKVLGSPVIRERSVRSLELVREAFLIGARTKRTVTPMRLLHDQCPHWREAADSLAGPSGTESDTATSTTPPVQADGTRPPWDRPVVAAPSPLQESPTDVSTPLSPAEEVRLARERIAAAKDRLNAAVPAARLHAQTMAVIDEVLSEQVTA
jgi:hypothetical protein